MTSAIGGWGNLVVPGKGMMLSKFPPEWQEKLSNLADDESGEHPGTRSACAVVMYDESKRTQKRMAMVVAGLMVTIILICAVMTGLTVTRDVVEREIITTGSAVMNRTTYAVVEQTKELRAGT
eukprot:gene670-64010_t